MFGDLLAARDTCSREWGISDHVVMLVEFDIFSAARMAVPGHTETRHGARPNRPIRITFFDRNAVRIDVGSLAPADLKRIAEHAAIVDDWCAGRLAAMPASSSTLIADRLAERLRGGL